MNQIEIQEINCFCYQKQQKVNILAHGLNLVSRLSLFKVYSNYYVQNNLLLGVPPICKFGGVVCLPSDASPGSKLGKKARIDYVGKVGEKKNTTRGPKQTRPEKVEKKSARPSLGV